jgi:lactoylglutathione lyase
VKEDGISLALEARMNAQSTSGEIKFRIRHTMMPVRDLDRSIDFYTRLLGMDIMRLRDLPDERVGYVGYGSEDDGPALEMIQYKHSGESKIPFWAGHVALYVSDLYKLAETLKAEGVIFTKEPQPMRPGSEDKVAFIRDPDGYTIELTERHALTGPPLPRGEHRR